MEEVWKEIDRFNGDYLVSNLGRIKTKNGYIKKLSVSNTGYLISSFKISKSKFRTYAIHRIVIETFLGKSELIVNHKDGNKLNNNLDNLEYCTYSYNIKHAYVNKLRKRKIDDIAINDIIQNHKKQSFSYFCKKYNIHHCSYYRLLKRING